MDEQSSDDAQGSDHHVHRREREIAIRQILEVISQSRDDEQPVFDVILENAANICNAPLGYLCMATEDRSLVTCPARRGAFAKFGETLDELQVPLAESPLALARAIKECEVFREDDIASHELYKSGDPDRVSMVEDEGARSLLVVPLVSDGRGVGSITLYRREVMPFSDDDVSLVESFAAQAVIAIENVRQFRELQTRLEREAASREILEVISDSRNDEQPVFDVILQKAAQLCQADTAGLNLVDNDHSHLCLVAYSGTLHQWQPGVDKWSLDSAAVSVRAFHERRVIQLEDLETPQGDLLFDRERLTKEGVRILLIVPLLRGDEALGCFGLFRKQAKAFSKDEIALVKTFAAQAVIAIENVRQFKALEARTKEVQALNASLEERVEEQVGEIERMSKLKRFLPAAVADTVVSSGSEEMLKSHRALLGVLFCDIRGFTAFCEAAEPEETIEVLQTYHEEMGKLINAHGAGVDLRMGDGIMVLFNDPIPCEDPAGNAVRLAIAMRDRMADLCKGWKRLGHRLGFGTGVSLGYATVGMVGFEGRFDYTASGTAINLAARLCDEATDGEILLSPRAQISVEDEFPTELKGESLFKGIREPVEVFRLAELSEG